MRVMRPLARICGLRLCRATRAVLLPLDEWAVEVLEVRAVERPDPRRNLAQKRSVVTHQQHGTVVFLERVLERFDVLDVEMVGRFVENQKMGFRERHERERHARTLAAAERADLAKHLLAAEAKGAETILHRPSAPERPLILDRVEQRLAERQVAEI